MTRLVTRFTFALMLLAGSFLPASPSFSQASKPGAAATAPQGAPLDINSASQDQLKALPGIGDAYSKRIVDNRPYTAKNQLITKGILPQATYDKIKDQIVAHRSTKP